MRISDWSSDGALPISARGPAGHPVRDHADLPVIADKEINVSENENTAEVGETFETNEEGIAYSSESAPSADAPLRPATIAPANAPGPSKAAVARGPSGPAPGNWPANRRAPDNHFPNKLH